jgi:hypothetical protein
MEEYLRKYNQLAKSFACRKLSFFLHVYLALPESEELKDDVKRNILQNRRTVLYDNKARKKARVAALCSYFRMNFVKLLFGFVRKR